MNSFNSATGTERETLGSAAKVLGKKDELIAIPSTALLKTLPENMRGMNWNNSELAEFSLHLEARALLGKLKTGKVVYHLNDLQEDIPEGLVSGDPSSEIELDLATVYSSVPPKLIQISSRISAKMEDVMNMPDYFSAKPGAIESPATDECPVLRPARHRQRFNDPWSGRERSNASVSPTDINTASADELSRIRGVGPKIAEQIIRYRKMYNGMESIYDLLSIPGIGVRNFMEMTGLDPEKRLDRSLRLNKMLGIENASTPRLPEICIAIAKRLNAKSCMLVGFDGITISKGHGLKSDPAEKCAALAPKIFKETRKYLGKIEAANIHMLALPAVNPPLLFISLDNLYMVLATYSTENISALSKEVDEIAGELNWLFSKRAVVAK